MDTTLPCNEPDPEARARQLAEARARYTYDYTTLAPLALASEVPDEADASLAWKAQLAALYTRLAVNSRKVQEKSGDPTTEDPGGPGPLAEIRAGRKPMERVLADLKQMVLTGHVTRRGTSVADFTELFVQFDPPKLGTSYDDDATFARLRVAGPNPLQIQRVARLDARFPVTDGMLRAVMGPHDSLAAAGVEGRLYLADYAALDGLPGGTYPVGQKYVTAPLALFALPAGTWGPRSLVPVAIQLAQQPGTESPIFTPADGVGWKIAKAFVNLADGNAHQAVHHLSQTHLVLEPIALATYRQLATAHPLSALLRPHFEGTLYINNWALTGLICPEGGVDAVLAGEIHAVQALCSKQARAWRFDENSLPAALRRRGVDDPALLGDYPYRDDALLVWGAIHSWVEAYLDLYYASSADVQADGELQAWLAELVSETGGRMKGIGQGGRIETLDYLVGAVTLIVFTASAQHAAVNFPQDPIMSYALALPLAAYAPPPRSKATATEAMYWEMQQPLGLANYQLLLGKLLGGLHHTELGQYATRWGAASGLAALVSGRDHVGFTDERVKLPLEAFQKRLAEVERLIDDRNASRPPYDFLLPSKIPQSINI